MNKVLGWLVMGVSWLFGFVRQHKAPICALAFAVVFFAAKAHATDPTVDDVLTAVDTNITKVGGGGAKAYLIAAGLALAGVLISFIRKAKR